MDMKDWIEWSGGECPVPVDTKIEIERRNGTTENLKAGKWDGWSMAGHSTDIVAYRIVGAPQ